MLCAVKVALVIPLELFLVWAGWRLVTDETGSNRSVDGSKLGLIYLLHLLRIPLYYFSPTFSLILLLEAYVV